MSNTQRAVHIARESILKLLSSEEIARVSNAEDAYQLSDGEEYLDLDHVDQGVLKAQAAATINMGKVLPRRAVHAETWDKILAQLAPPSR